MNCYFFITDKNCLDYAQIAIHSLLSTNPKNKIVLYAKDCNPVFPNTHTIPIKEIEHLDFKIPNLTVNALDLLGHRLKVLDELKEKYNKIIMLDTDIIVLENIDDLFNLSENYIYGNDEIEIHNRFRKSINNELWYNPKFYLNSGVLVLPSKVLKTVNLYDKLKKELSLRSEKYVCPEQDLLNFVFKDKTFNLGDKINQFVTNKQFDKPKIIHYAGPAKPIRTDRYFMKQCKWFYDVFDYYLDLNRQNISNDFYVKNKIALQKRNTL